MKRYLSEFYLGSCLLLLVAFGLYLSRDYAQTPIEEIPSPEPPAPEYKYGLDISQHSFMDYPIRSGTFMGDVLMSFNVNFDKIIALEKKAEEIHSLRKILAGKKITLVSKDACADPDKFIYRPDRFTYVIYEFGDSVHVGLHKIPYETCIESATGVVTNSLWNTFEDENLDWVLFDYLERALSQVNFFKAQKGDKFRVVYEQKYIDGDPVSVGKVYAASYLSGDHEDYSFYFENEKYKGFYDMEGTPTQKTFMRDPVSSRISSYFNPNRFHPILKRRRAHLGTDYAAPTGTPISAVADGVISKRSYTKGNGNYIKIKHDRIYETQYLHMSRFAKGLKVGSRVERGQTIGYVGSTGLATGPHVCFRFWKNGRQVNHLRENFPPLDPMPENDLPEFFEERNEFLALLNMVDYRNQPVVLAGFSEISADD